MFQAKFHWLVLPVAHISHPYQLKTEHVDLVQHMLKVDLSLIELVASAVKHGWSNRFRCSSGLVMLYTCKA